MTRERFVLRLASLMFGLAISGMCAWAQYTSAIEGTVTDPSGAVVPNATVTVRNVETGISQSVSTSAGGYYRVEPLPAAAFTVTVSASGFETAVEPEFRIQVKEIKTVNVTLRVGRATTEVTVTAAPQAVETSLGRVSGVIDQSQVHELPLVGRNFYTLVVLTPGVTGVPSGGGQSYAQATGDIFTTEYGVGLNANGQRGINNEFSCDSASVQNVCHGGLVNFDPNADAVQEVRVSVNNFSADTGRHSSVMVNTITKQGTDLFHGTLGEFFTNNELQSRNIFQLPSGPVFRRNEGNWSFGGPIKKDKTFFFGSMDFLRSGVGYGYAAVVATPQFINFMNSNFPNKIATYIMNKFPAAFAPVSNFTTAGNVQGVDCSTLTSPDTPISTEIGPVPCNMALTGTGTLSTEVPRNGTQWGVRIDHSFNNDKDRLYGSVWGTDINTVLFNTPSPYPAFTRPWAEGNNFQNLSETHIFSPTKVNEFGFSYNRTHGSGLCQPWCAIPDISILGMPDYGIGGLAPGTFIQNNYELREMFAFNHGTQALKVGLQKQWGQDYDNFGPSDIRPHYQFNTILDFANDTPEYEYNVGIDPKTALPLSTPAGYIDDREANLAFFIQDDWKVKPNFTLNLGLRWDDFENPDHRYDHTENILFDGGDTFFERIANARVDFTPNHHVYARTQYTNFGPRVGLAWDPTKKGKFSVRAGAGIFYTRIPTCNISGLRSNPPIWANVTASIYTPPVLPVYGLGTSDAPPFGFPAVTGIKAGLDSKNGLLAGKANLTGVDRNFDIPYSVNWFLGLQYAFTNNWMFEADYIGSEGHKELDNFNINRFAGDLIQNNDTFTGLNHSFGAMNESQSLANSFYTGGTVVLKRRFTRGLTVNAAYTVGKAIDGTDIGGGGNENNVNVADIANLRRERGLAVFDIRNRLSLTDLWEVPRPKTKSSVVNWLGGGWQLSHVTILQGGTPYSVICSIPFSPVYNTAGVIVGNSGCDYNADGTNYDYPMTPAWGNSRNGSRSRFERGLFTAADFPAPPLGQEGNLGRDTFIGPGFANTDFSLMKVGKIPWFIGREGAAFEFRLEVFNIFNRVNLTNPNNDLAAPTLLGTSTGTYNSRDFQIGLRIKF